MNLISSVELSFLVFQARLALFAQNHQQEDHLLLEMPTVLITPHNAFNTKEALMRILNTTINNINAFKKGKKVVNVV